MKKLLHTILLLCLLHHHNIIAQDFGIQVKPIEGIPTKTIYDLLLDRQNFLWMATEVGVFRYDGITFTAFSSPEQSSLATSGLLQDDQGKIWFQNFSGQIFYIENEKTFLLKSYQFQNESKFPRIVILNGSLIATSDKGLFICNTKTLESKYLSCRNAPWLGTTSLALIRDKIVAHGAGNWFIYDSEHHLRLVRSSVKVSQYDASFLHTQAHADTIFFFSNPSATLDQIGIRNDSIILFKRHDHKHFINTISILGQKVWINTVKTSVNLTNKSQLKNQNISDMVTDQEGNTWFSSLDNGLLVNFRHLFREKIKLPSLPHNDLVKTMVRYGNELLLGTQNGKLYLYDYSKKRFSRDLTPPHNSHSIYKITSLSKGEFLIGTAIHTYRLNLMTGRIVPMNSIAILKETDHTENFIFAATANGLVIHLEKRSEKLKEYVSMHFKGITEYDQASNSFFFPRRCSSLAYNPIEKALYVAFKNGVYKIDQKGIIPLKHNAKHVYSQSLVYYNGKIYIGTINQGLLIYHDNKFVRHSINSGLLSDNILGLKKSNSKLWVISAGAIQLFDMNTSSLHSDNNFSVYDNIETSDLIDIDNKVYLATRTGLYVIPLETDQPREGLTNFILSIHVNNKLSNNETYFLPNQNSIQFKIGIPLYYRAEQTYIKYCLMTDNDSTWNMTEPGERNITFASLMPGKYTFNATAVNPELGQALKPIKYEFEILHSWWQNKYFQVVIVAIFVCFIFYIVLNYYLNKLSFKRILFQQELSIKKERQRISREIHDDIGAGIFAIKLYADVSNQNRKQHDDIGQIAVMINDISKKIREIIWSTNVENDNLEDLIWFLKEQAIKLFSHSNINFRSSIPEHIPQITVIGQDRKNIYLLVREFIHNAIKHSFASEISLQIKIINNFLHIEITDNGVGFNTDEVRQDAMGLINAQLRVKELGGKFEVLFNSGTKIHIQIPIG